MNASRRSKTGKPGLKQSVSDHRASMLLNPKRGHVSERVADNGVFAGRQWIKRTKLHVVYEYISIPARLDAQTFQDSTLQFYVVAREGCVSRAPFDHRYADFALRLLTRQPH